MQLWACAPSRPTVDQRSSMVLERSAAQRRTANEKRQPPLPPSGRGQGTRLTHHRWHRQPDPHLALQPPDDVLRLQPLARHQQLGRPKAWASRGGHHGGAGGMTRRAAHLQTRSPEGGPAPPNTPLLLDAMPRHRMEHLPRAQTTGMPPTVVTGDAGRASPPTSPPRETPRGARTVPKPSRGCALRDPASPPTRETGGQGPSAGMGAPSRV